MSEPASNLSSPTSPVKSGTSEEEPSSSTEPNDDFKRDLMTSSYTEISFGDSDTDADHTDADDLGVFSEAGDRNLIHDNSSQSLHLAGSMSLPQLSSTIVNWSERAKAEYENYDASKEATRPPTTDSRMSAQQEDVEHAEDALVTYVAEDIHEKLRLSSPQSSRSYSLVSDDNHRESPSESSPLNFQILKDIERQTEVISRNVNSVVGHISEYTHNVTSITANLVKKYESILMQTCDDIDGNIKLMYQLMAKCEELNQAMAPINSLSSDIKEVKRLLDLFEKSIENKAFS